MTSFLFWNLNKKPLESIVSNIAKLYDVDVIMLVECNSKNSSFLKALNVGGKVSYHYSPGIGCKKVEVFTKFPKNFIQPKSETSRLTIRHLNLPGNTDILLAITHFPSKINWAEGSQGMECVELSNHIKSAEEKVGHSRTILVGDLNMNPFEIGVTSANGLHGVMTKAIAEQRERTVQEKIYPMFYNPMWNFFGDRTSGPPGTHFYRGSTQQVFFWNMFDQVLIRPDLISRFEFASLKILESDGNSSLLKASGIPDDVKASDHLPILFTMSL